MKYLNFIYLFLILPLVAHAGLFRLESETLTSARNGDDQKFEFPMHEFLAANYQSANRELELNANLSVAGDATRNKNSFNLYLLNLSYFILPDTVEIGFGRSFDLNHSIRTNAVDLASIDFYGFEKKIKWGFFVGKEQRVEYKQFTPFATLFGSNLSYTSASQFPLFAKLKFQNRNFDRSTLSDERLIQASLTKSFAVYLNPEFILDSEFNVGSKNLNRLEGSLVVYPNYKTSLQTKLQTFEVKPQDGIEQPLFSIFSLGRLYEASLLTEHQFTSNLSASLALAYDNYLLQTALRTDGVKIETALEYRWLYASVRDAVYILKSYGGEAYCNRLTLAQKLSENFSLNEGVDVVFYNKVTSSRRTAFNSQLGIAHNLGNYFKLNIDGEFNSNNNLQYDIRGILKLTYLLWTET